MSSGDHLERLRGFFWSDDVGPVDRTTFRLIDYLESPWHRYVLSVIRGSLSW